MRKVIVCLMLLQLAACAHITDAKRETSTAAPQDRALVARFADVIWPTILQYRYSGQGDPQTPPGPRSGMATFNSVVDVTNQIGSVKLEAENIGEVLDAKGVSTGETEHLALATTNVSSLNAADAEVIACYTYSFTARSEWPHTNDHAVPGASEVTFTLHKVDDWLVRKISNDHVVTSCAANKA
jgi:hypothetical protein